MHDHAENDAAGRRGAGTGTEAQLRVIRKLLTRAESTEFDAERDACLAKVAELMARHCIEEALVWAARDESTREAPVHRLMVVPAPYAARKVTLYGAVGAANSCTVIDVGSDARGERRVAVVGFRGDVDRVEVLVTSLLVQLSTAMLSHRVRAPSASSVAAWRRSFVTAFALRVGERLQEARRRQVADQEADRAGRRGGGRSGSRRDGPSTALVLAERDDAVADAVRAHYPRLRSTRIDGGSSAGGYAAGRVAGDRADLGGGRIDGRRRALGS